jgi:hypothetical protein
MNIYNYTISSESGDDYGTFPFNFKPTDDELFKWMKNHFGDDHPDFEKGPGFCNTYFHVKGPIMSNIVYY